MHFDLEDAVLAGTAYGLYRHGQDEQTADLIAAVEGLADQPTEIHIHLDGENKNAPVVNALDYATDNTSADWRGYIGQEPLKDQIMVHIRSAQARGDALPHTLLASGYPGVGKTHLARLIAKTMGVPIIEIVPPFNIYTLVKAAEQLPDHGILFIDEIHGLANSGAKGAEILLKVMEDHVAYMPDGEVIQLNNITIIGATTDRDKLPEPVIDRFKIKPYFQAYSPVELVRIAISFAYRHQCESAVDDDTAITIALACRGTPRITEEMVLSCRDLALARGHNPTGDELLSFMEVEPDGLTRTHIHYLTALRQYFQREDRNGNIEYIVGEAAIQQILRETKQGIGRVERFLIEQGLIDRTPRGRRLTDLGIERAEEFIAEGKGVSDV